MSLTAFFLIGGSVFLHALWHFLSKSQKPHIPYFAVVSSCIFLTLSVIALAAGGSPFHVCREALPYAVAGGLAGACCDMGLSFAYRFSEMSQAYPMARALPVLFTTLITAAFGFGKALTPAASAAMFIIFIGCVIMPLPSWHEFKWSVYKGRGMFGILLAACGTTAYTIIDGFGMQNVHTHLQAGDSALAAAAAYSAMRELSGFLLLITIILIRPEERRSVSRNIFKHFHPYVSGVSAAVAYLLILLSMPYVTNVSYVQAFRQLSLPLGIILGIVFLKEKITPQKTVASILILGGLAASAFL